MASESSKKKQKSNTFKLKLEAESRTFLRDLAGSDGSRGSSVIWLVLMEAVVPL